MRRFTLLLAVLLGTTAGLAQNTQTIRGMVRDIESKAPLIGATVMVIQDSATIAGAMTDTLGRYRLDNIPVGRVLLVARYIGYEDFALPNLTVNSGREVIQDINLAEAAVEIETVEIVASDKDQTLNEMATVSARTFSIEEADRYAGSRGDPARMVTTFAGVRGGDDSRNDIVVRGNSPLGVVYRMEGIDIPNPNHFSMIGGTGGPVSILDNKVLSNSDFFTGAFPAEYGNGTAAVFDLNMRNGNNEKYEFTGQLSTLGAQAMVEGPISRTRRSSFLLNYRYSTIAIMELAGINFGIAALPRYQDFAFKFNFPGKSKGTFSVFGIGGKSDITISNSERDTSDIYNTDIGKDVRFGSRMITSGMNYTHLISDKAWLKASLYTSYNYTYTEHDTIDNLSLPSDQQTPGLFMRMKYNVWRSGAALMYNHKFSPRLSLRSGIHLDYISTMGIDSSRYLSPNAYRLRADYQGSTVFSRAYVQVKYKLRSSLTLNAGLHSQFLALNSDITLEPRLGLRWQVAERHALNLGYGLHHQMQPMHVYFQELPDARTGTYAHQDIKFTRSQHLVAGWDWRIGNNIRSKVEAYYQALSHIPVELGSSAFSMVNLGSNFTLIRPDTVLQNTGTGTNYGVEITLEKFFSHGYFFMGSGSLYESKYMGSDGVLRDTDYNGQFGFALTGGKEFALGKQRNTVLGAASSIFYSGGRRITPIDWDRSRVIGEYAGIDSLTNTLQLKDYFRADLRVYLRINGKKVSHEIAFDGVNILNLENELGVLYDPTRDKWRIVPQLNFFPIVYYRIEF